MSITKVYLDKEQLRLNHIIKTALKEKNKQFLIDIGNGHIIGIFEYKMVKDRDLVWSTVRFSGNMNLI